MFTTPSIIYYFLLILVFILLILLFANLIFYTSLSLIGLKKPVRNYSLEKDKNKFLFIVPAHNEESVIKDTLASMLYQNYDSDLYDVVVIADNCTDRTVEIVNTFEHVNLFVNTSKKGERRGKPHAIAKFIQTKTWQNYDYVAFIDADNIVHPDYLKEMNSQLIAHPHYTAIQGYLGVKNVASSITASGYAAVYFITNRAVQYAKHLLGWNAAIGGTGFILATDYILVHGWNPRSYTEDFELQVELSLQGKVSGWNHFAKVYDEKPNNLLASHNQRTRWAQGHWFVAITTTAKQLVSIFKATTFPQFQNRVETLFYSYSMLRPVAFLAILFLGLIDWRLINFLPHLFSLAIYWSVIELLNFIIIPFVYLTDEAALYFEQKSSIFAKIGFFFRLIIAFLWNSLTYLFPQIIGFCTWFIPQNNWKKTEHNASFEQEVN